MPRALFVVAIVIAAGTISHADPDPDPDPAPDHLAQGRALYERGDYPGARAELLLAYEADPRPDLLFALGQVEFHLEHYDAAIDYYQRFLATAPSEHDAALAQQALGAARTAQRAPPPTTITLPPRDPPPIRTRRRWSRINWILSGAGAGGIVVGTGVIFYGHRRSTDRTGSLADYDDRVRGARRLQWIGVGVSAVGLAVLATAFIRYGLHRERVEIGVTATGTEVGVTLSGAL
jgi:tetratricopeptide (TPR) repeat protein